jgi:hypothetical protein
MNKHPVILAFLFAAGLFYGQALAVTLTLQPSSQTIDPSLGEKAIVGLEISGLTENGPSTLGAFGVEITFSQSILSFDSVTYGAYLGDPGNVAETDIVTTTNPSSVFLDEFSFLSVDQLDQLQPASFLLASLTFEGRGTGTNPLGFKVVDLSDTMGNTVALASLEGSTIKVVPLPHTLGLLASAAGLLLVGWGLRKRMC